jgi:hypothetical protein
MNKNIERPKLILILGSGPDARDAAQWDDRFDAIVAINNAWQIRTDWDYLIHPEDFPAERQPTSVDVRSQRIITATDYVPVQNQYGGFVYAGATMAFTAGYWALGALKPDVMAFFGCDMSYDTGNGQTHFYGNGAADPLRNDVTLQSLEAKSARLMLTAAGEQCLTVNLSEGEDTRQVFPRLSLSALRDLDKSSMNDLLSALNTTNVREASAHVLEQEKQLAYYVPSGRYWEEAQNFDPAALRAIDGLWMAALKTGRAGQTS